jgi:hypothetical protein
VEALGLTTFAQRPFSEAVQEAPLIVRGTVGERSVDWATDADGTRRIYTFHELRVGEVLKADAAREGASAVLEKTRLVMREIGGEKDGVGIQVSGAARFEPGEEVVVFLGLPPNPDGSFGVYGLMMAKLQVVRGPSGEELLSGPALAGEAAHGHPESDGIGGPKPLPIGELRALIARQGGAPRTVQPEEGKKSAPESTPPAPAEKNVPASVGGEPVASVERREEVPAEGPPPRASASSWLIAFWLLMGALAFLGLSRRWKASRRS